MAEQTWELCILCKVWGAREWSRNVGRGRSCRAWSGDGVPEVFSIAMGVLSLHQGVRSCAYVATLRSNAARRLFGGPSGAAC
eukprot:341413-Chlamydomonas_euryale.AAC.1